MIIFVLSCITIIIIIIIIIVVIVVSVIIRVFILFLLFLITIWICWIILTINHKIFFFMKFPLKWLKWWKCTTTSLFWITSRWFLKNWRRRIFNMINSFILLLCCYFSRVNWLCSYWCLFLLKVLGIWLSCRTWDRGIQDLFDLNFIVLIHYLRLSLILLLKIGNHRLIFFSIWYLRRIEEFWRDRITILVLFEGNSLIIELNLT
jgi:hypothetical protein